MRPGSPSSPGRSLEAGHEVVVVAPSTEASGAGAGVGPLHVMGGGIQVEAVAPPGLEGITALAVDGLPALIVITACLGAFGPPPDLVATGINPGRNVGRAVLHSGTVGAALTSVHFGLKGLATSIQAGALPSGFESANDGHPHYESAAVLAVVLAAHLEGAPAAHGAQLECAEHSAQTDSRRAAGAPGDLGVDPGRRHGRRRAERPFGPAVSRARR